MNEHTEFQIDVSRRFKNKDGYKPGNAYALNLSFVTETHTPKSFVDSIIKGGWPYTMVHQKRPPEETGAAARGVTTPKHTENFISRQELTLDDDGKKQPDVIDRWMSDPFFNNFGLIFSESASSRPGAERGHAVFLFDQPIDNPNLYQDCLRAACAYWSAADWLINIDRTVYNAAGANIHILGNICPFDIFQRVILQPYLSKEAEKKRQLEEQILKQRPVNGREPATGYYRAFLAGYIDWVFGKVAEKQTGDNRNAAIYWAGRTVAGIEASDWARPYLDLLAGVESSIIRAATQNGYLESYAHNNTEEVLRIFRLGRLRGGEQLEKPIPQAKSLPSVDPSRIAA